MQATRAVSSWVQWFWHVQKIIICSMPPQPLSYSILWCFQSPGGRCDTDVLFRAKHCAIIDSLQFVQLWVPVLTAIQCSKRLSWWKLRAALIYGFKDNHLEGSLTFCWVSRMIEGSRSCEFPNYRFLVLCMSSILWNGLNSNQKVAGYATTFVPLLYLWAHLATHSIFVAFGVHSQ